VCVQIALQNFELAETVGTFSLKSAFPILRVSRRDSKHFEIGFKTRRLLFFSMKRWETAVRHVHGTRGMEPNGEGARY